VHGQGRDLDVHVREERQARQQCVELVARVHVEAADVGVAPDDPPELGPLPGALDLVGALALPRAKIVGDVGGHVVGEADLHADEELHAVLRVIDGRMRTLGVSEATSLTLRAYRSAR
jgi:hypothetical protein